MRPQQNFKANANGFYVSEKDHYSHQMGQFDCLNDSPCDDTMGFSLSDITSSITSSAEKLYQQALTAGQTALIKEGTKLVNNTLGTNVTPTQIVGATPAPIVNTTYVDQPMDKNLKIALIAGGSLVGVLLLVTVIKGITK